MAIDWNNPEDKISKYFTVREALWLPSWKVLHIPSEKEKENIIKHAANMDKVRELLDRPIIVNVWIRPVLNNPESVYHGLDYNTLVKGSKYSYHRSGLATDFRVEGKTTCDTLRKKIEPKLKEFGIRMENSPGSNWVHVDSGTVIINRYFKP